MKLLIVGSAGMAGHVVAKYLAQQGHTVSTVARTGATFNLDIEDTVRTTEFFMQIKNDFDFIINCVGLLVKDSMDRPDRAAVINSWFPHCIEQSIKDSNTRLIHLSTDCVFDGSKGNYIESDIHTEMNFYGRSKSLGEINNSKDITFRMSIIGPELKSTGTGLLKWILSNNESTLNGWDNAMWNGITTLELAKCIEKYMNNSVVTGVYHLVNNDNYISKYDLLKKINDVYALEKTIVRTQGPKPVNKILIDTRKEFNFSICDYDTMLVEMKNFS